MSAHLRADWISHLRGTRSRIDDLTRPSRRTESRARRQAARLFAQRRRRPRRVDLEDLSRRRRLRRHPLGERRAGLCAGADARDLRRGHREPQCADRDQAGLRAGKPARCRRRAGHRDLGRGRCLPVAAEFHAAGRQRRVARAGAGTGARQHAAARHRLRARRSPRRAGESRCRPILSWRAT